MIDVAKVNRMTAELENFARSHGDIYLLPEILAPNIFALLKKINVRVKAILVNENVASGQEIFGCPVISLNSAIPSFTLTTGIIYFSGKTQTNLIMTLNFNFGVGSINLPTFVISQEEADSIYDRLTVMKILQQYQDDGLPAPSMNVVANRLVSGISTFLDPAQQDLKYQLWDRVDFGRQTYDTSEIAIVIQGPLEYKNNCTAVTAQIYRQRYPNAPIVVSTWKNEATAEFREFCAQNNIALLENDLPEESGDGNVNYQLESSYRGIEFIKKNSAAKFVLKCRTDQRINRPDFLIYFKNLLTVFPPNGNKLERRIIVLQSQRWSPFFLADFLTFGTIKDLEKFYSIPHESREAEILSKRMGQRSKLVAVISKRRSLTMDKPFLTGRKLRNYNRMMDKFFCPESFIIKSFCNLHIEQIVPENLMDIFMRLVRDYFIVVDTSSILIDWKKYPYIERNTFYGVHCESFLEIDAATWLDIYLNYKTATE